MNEKEQNIIGRQYFIENIFSSFEEYQRYLIEALALFQDQIKKRNPSFKKYVPEYLEIEFVNSIRAPRLYFPRYKSTIVVQLPANGAAPRKRETIRTQMLQRFVAVVKINEIAVAEEIAMRMKILGKKTRGVK